MRKIPTLFVRNPDERRYVTDEVTPGCEWVLAGEGVATRKYDGTCVAKIDGIGWVARREVKADNSPPPNFIGLDTDGLTGKSVGWEPIERSPFFKFWREAVSDDDSEMEGTYELCGPKINGNPEGYSEHTLIRHAAAETLVPLPGSRAVAACRFDATSLGWEGIVWHHPDGRMAKLKARDYPTTSPVPPMKGEDDE